MASIEFIGAREILDSRGNPTVEVEVILDDGSEGRAAVPSGASTGAFEAVELRDGDKRYGGKGVNKAVLGVIDQLGPELLGFEASEQRLVDQAMIDIDGTDNKNKIGANAILGVSLAVAHAAAHSADLPLYRYVGGPNAHLLPVPMMNIVNGGAHADSDVDVQEFMIAPIGAPTFRDALEQGAERLPRAEVGAEEAGPVDRAGRRGRLRAEPAAEPGRAGADRHRRGGHRAQAGHRHRLGLRRGGVGVLRPSNGVYTWEGGAKSADEMTAIYEQWIADFPIVSIEDPLAEDDWAGWSALMGRIGDKVQVVGDDLFVTNVTRLQKGISERAASALLVKVNQIGSLTETLDAVDLAHRNGFRCMMSHRSGETEDTTIADLAVATNCGQIKSGAPARTDRVAKYNQLLRIEEDLDDAARYAGASAFPRFKA